MTAKQVKERMEQRGVRQADLAKRWKIQSAIVSKLVNRALVSKRLDQRLARAIGVTLDELRGSAQPGK